MRKDQKFNILSEGIKNGVSATCRKHHISRTIYYRWLKKYQTQGIEGLNDVKKAVVPVNKTSIEIETALLGLIKTYPTYGPKAIKYLLDEIDYRISESAVYNVMKRRHLTTKENRIRFAKKKDTDVTPAMPSFDGIGSGECWFFWITDYGDFPKIGHIYEHTFYDYKSRIACSRLYHDISYINFEDLMNAVAMPVAQTLNFQTKYLCFFLDAKIIRSSKNIFKTKINHTLEENGLDVQVHAINASDDFPEITTLRRQYTEICLSFLMPLIQDGHSFSALKLKFQNYIRTYNIQHKMHYTQGTFSPIDYHNNVTDTKLILPLWAYIDRDY